MNLTEVLLAVIISMAVIAGSYFLYTTVTEKNAMTQTMENLSLLRANIEDIYDGTYDENDTFGDIDKMYKMGIIPQFFVANADDGEGGTAVTMRSHWGAIELAPGDDTAHYTIELKDLSGDACMHFGRFQYKSWSKIEVGTTPVWNRSTDTKASISELSTACTGTGAKSVKFTAP